VVVALVVACVFVVAVLAVLVAGLLRSHADILRSLHELGVGVGDPAAPLAPHSAGGAPGGAAPIGAAPVSLVTTAPGPASAPALGAAPAVAGVTPSGDARAVAVDNSNHLTLLAFLSSGCTSCRTFWDALQSAEGPAMPGPTRVVIVTKGPDREIPAEVSLRSTGAVPVVMSTEAWLDYEVPGSPFFVLVDGSTGRKVGQGVASHVGQLVELVRRAEIDRASTTSTTTPPAAPARSTVADRGLDGPAREEATDEVLRAAGILPGDPSLYPRSLEDVFPFSDPASPASPASTQPRSA
jgi:hypothetical protein